MTQCACNGCGGRAEWLAENKRKFEEWLAAQQEQNIIPYVEQPSKPISVADVLKEMQPTTGENVHDFINRMRKVES